MFREVIGRVLVVALEEIMSWSQTRNSINSPASPVVTRVRNRTPAS